MWLQEKVKKYYMKNDDKLNVYFPGEVTERATPPKIHAKVNAIVNKNVRSSVVENNAQLGTGQNCCIHAEDITRAILNQTVQTGENQGN